MNSYSRETLRHGAHRTANGPYGAPRGNAVMAAKRTSGQSARAALQTACAIETCDDCERAPLLTWTVDGLIHRSCGTDCKPPVGIAALERPLAGGAPWRTA